MWFGMKHVSVPTYERDVVGEIKQWDERDIAFARSDLFNFFGEGSQEFKEYYDKHREMLRFDKIINKKLSLGKTGGIDTPMFQSQFDVINHISAEDVVDGEAAGNKIDIPKSRASLKVKELAKFLGADLVGIGRLRQEWVYSHVGRSRGNKDGFQVRGTPIELQNHTNAVALGFRMDYDLIKSAPDFPELLATAQAYAISAWVSVQLADYIRRMGYSARAHHFRNYQLLTVPVAVDCGLGELSRAGFLLTKELGSGLRLSVVTTDMPMKHDRPVDIGVQSFCESCKICAEECPVGAIPKGKKEEFNGVMRWKLAEEKCYSYWGVASTDCGTCMVACPWTKPSNWLHRFITHLAAIKGPHQMWLTRADKFFYGPHKPAPRPEYLDDYIDKG